MQWEFTGDYSLVGWAKPPGGEVCRRNWLTTAGPARIALWSHVGDYGL
jgi:hypothetical protein